MKKLLIVLGIMLLGGVGHAQIVNNSGSTAADSIAIPFFLLDSIGNMATLTANDSVFLHVYRPNGALAFQDTVAQGSSLITVTTVAGYTTYAFKAAVADIDGAGADGLFSYIIYTDDNTGANLGTPHKGFFQLYQAKDFNTWATFVNDSTQAIIDSLQRFTKVTTDSIQAVIDTLQRFTKVTTDSLQAVIDSLQAYDDAGGQHDRIWDTAFAIIDTLQRFTKPTTDSVQAIIDSIQAFDDAGGQLDRIADTSFAIIDTLQRYTKPATDSIQGIIDSLQLLDEKYTLIRDTLQSHDNWVAQQAEVLNIDAWNPITSSESLVVAMVPFNTEIIDVNVEQLNTNATAANNIGDVYGTNGGTIRSTKFYVDSMIIDTLTIDSLRADAAVFTAFSAPFITGDSVVVDWSSLTGFTTIIRDSLLNLWPDGSVNLLTNPSFERVSGGTLMGWETITGNVNRDIVAARGGKYGLILRGDAVNSGVVEADSFYLNAGDVVLVGVKWRDVATASGDLNIYNSGGSSIGTMTLAVPNRWIGQLGVIRNSGSAGHFRLRFSTNATGVNDSLYVDEVFVGVSPLIDNSISTTTFVSNAIGASDIAADAIGASELAGDAASEIADSTWKADTTGFTAGGSFGYAVTHGAAATISAADMGLIADSVWTYDTTAFAGGNTAGVALARTYDTARAIIDTLQNKTNWTIATVTTATNLTTNNDKTGYTLTAAEHGNISDSVWKHDTTGFTNGGTFGYAVTHGTPGTLSASDIVAIADTVFHRDSADVNNGTATSFGTLMMKPTYVQGAAGDNTPSAWDVTDSNIVKALVWRADTNTFNDIAGSFGKVLSDPAYVGDVQAINGDATAADNFETMLDGTGGQTLSLGRLKIVASGNDTALIARGSGSGHGIYARGGTSGAGIYTIGGTSSGSGTIISAGGSGAGVQIVGVGTGAGINVSGGATNGPGILATGNGSGDALALSKTSGSFITTEARQEMASTMNDSVWFAAMLDYDGTVGTYGDSAHYWAQSGAGITDAQMGAIADSVWTYDTTAFANGNTAGVALARTYDSARAIIDTLQRFTKPSTDSIQAVLDTLQRFTKPATDSVQASLDSLQLLDEKYTLIRDTLQNHDNWVARETSIADSVWMVAFGDIDNTLGSVGDSAQGWGATAASSFNPATDSVMVDVSIAQNSLLSRIADSIWQSIFIDRDNVAGSFADSAQGWGATSAGSLTASAIADTFDIRASGVASGAVGVSAVQIANSATAADSLAEMTDGDNIGAPIRFSTMHILPGGNGQVDTAVLIRGDTLANAGVLILKRSGAAVKMMADTGNGLYISGGSNDNPGTGVYIEGANGMEIQGLDTAYAGVGMYVGGRGSAIYLESSGDTTDFSEGDVIHIYQAASYGNGHGIGFEMYGTGRHIELSAEREIAEVVVGRKYGRITAAGTTWFKATTFNEADNYWNDNMGFMVFGGIEEQAFQVDSFFTSSDSFMIDPPFSTAPSVGDTVVILALLGSAASAAGDGLVCDTCGTAADSCIPGADIPLYIYLIDTCATPDDTLPGVSTTIYSSTGVNSGGRTSNSAGYVQYTVTTGTWTVVASKGGYVFNDTSYVVTALDTVAMYGCRVDVGTPVDPDLGRVYGFLRTIEDDPIDGATVTATLHSGKNQSDSTGAEAVIISDVRGSAASDSTGYWFMDLRRTFNYADTTRGFYDIRGYINGKPLFEVIKLRVPNTGNVNVGDVLSTRQ